MIRMEISNIIDALRLTFAFRIKLYYKLERERERERELNQGKI